LLTNLPPVDDISDLNEAMKAMEDENRRLKRMFAELSMQNELLKKALGKNRPAISTPRDGRSCCGEAGCQHCVGVPDVWGERDVHSL
jgi:putative transposase